MFLKYYRLWEQPFGATPDARFLFASGTHREALASLMYGIDAGRGFVALIAEPGMGKTTLLFHSVGQMAAKTKTVFLFQTIGSPIDFLRALLTDLGIQDVQGDLIQLQAELNRVLVEQASQGERLVVVVDEAQNLDGATLEFVRMLSNFETQRNKLMQIVLAGQPQLAAKLASHELLQLRQRISIVAHLRPLSAEDTAQYVAHRLKVAGRDSEKPLFTAAALRLIAKQSGGIPRNINNLCFNALSLGCALQRSVIDVDVIQEVIGDLDLGEMMPLAVRAETDTEPRTKTKPVRAGSQKRSVFSLVAPLLSRNLGKWLPAVGMVMAAAAFTGWVVAVERSTPVAVPAVTVVRAAALPKTVVALPPPTDSGNAEIQADQAMAVPMELPGVEIQKKKKAPARRYPAISSSCTNELGSSGSCSSMKLRQVGSLRGATLVRHSSGMVSGNELSETVQGGSHSSSSKLAMEAVKQ